MANASNNSFTRTESKILRVLSDGLQHTKQELEECMDDKLAGRTAMNVHLHRIRKKLKPLDQLIVCEWRSRRLYYRRVNRYIPPHGGE